LFSIDDHIPKLNAAGAVSVYRSPLLLRCNQNTQNCDSRAINLKLNELIRAMDKVPNQMIDLENQSDLVFLTPAPIRLAIRWLARPQKDDRRRMAKLFVSFSWELRRPNILANGRVFQPTAQPTNPTVLHDFRVLWQPPRCCKSLKNQMQVDSHGGSRRFESCSAHHRINNLAALAEEV
jgi:hypothetical protein